MNKYFKSGATLTAMALVLSLTPMQSALTDTADELRLLRQQMAEMAKRLEELEAKQEQTQKEVELLPNNQGLWRDQAYTASAEIIGICADKLLRVLEGHLQ